MKNPFNFRCSLYQWLISIKTAGNEPLGKLTQRHIHSCSECKSRWEDEKLLTSRLRHEAPQNRIIPPASLHFRVMTAVHQQQRPGATEIQPAQSWVRKLMPATGLACIIMLCFMLFRPTPIPQDTSTLVSSLTWEKSVDSLTRNLDMAHGSTALEWTGKLENSLDQEMKSLVKDAKMAVATLTHSFLPEHTHITLRP